MKSFNLSTWSLEHPSLVAYLMVVLTLGGVLAYFNLGRSEDPDFTIKLMVVRSFWPGATAPEVEQQVTDRIEKKLQELPYLDNLRSYSKPGESLIFVELRDFTPPKKVPELWYQVRKKLDDIRHTLPEGVRGPFPNDEFGDAFGNVFALTGDGYSMAELRRQADRISQELRRIPDVAKVELAGVQDERIWIEMSAAKLATLGLDPRLILQTLQAQNAMTPAGFVETSSDRIRMRVSGSFDNVESIRAIGIRAGDKLFKLGDVAKVWRGYADPQQPHFRWQGKPGIALSLSMTRGGNVLALGERLQAEVARVRGDLPVGLELHQVADQPEVVRRNVDEFMRSLLEAIAIVLAVSFISLGLRTGLVVALSIPVVLAVTFLLMKPAGIDLQRISLGALIIALGLLVDDAIIAVEMMVVKMEQGWEKSKAAAFAYTSTAFPMLTGTLITAAGFLPVGFAKSAAGEYTFSIFAVVGIALLTSWVAAVLFIPWLGSRLLNREALMAKAAKHSGDPYASPFYRRVKHTVNWCVGHRWVVIGLTLATFALSIVGFKQGVEKQFFPTTNRPELLIDLWLPQGASVKATDIEVKRVEALLASDPELKGRISHHAVYVGMGSVRFFLPLDPQLPNDNFAQFVLMTTDLKAREVVKARLEQRLASEFTGLRGRVLRLENGPPVGFPVQFRVSGRDPETLRRLAGEVATVMRAHPYAKDVHLDWNERVKQVRLHVDQDKARALGVSSQELSLIVNNLLNGVAITQFREGDQLIDVMGRAEAGDRERLSRLADLQVHTRDGRFVPLSQIATLTPELEEGLIWRRDRLPTITVRGDLREGIQAPTVSAAINPKLDAIRAKLPLGYRIEVGGTVEKSAHAENSIRTGFPLAIIVVVTLLMIQLQSVQRTLLVLLTAPLGMIGVTASLLLFQVPFGFVAQLGVIALFGMIMRNSVILVDQIEQDIAAGHAVWDAIVGATVRRFRPIMLTALAAILAMIPLTRSVFWGPMATAIMGGLFIATVLTLLFLPALYAAWFRVRRPAPLANA
ncbi:MAG: efflux RND transporter permease subunit [Pseudomonadota bacterium]|nr:efflux RND transporter permease subunit [Pseudomonadota bacterium]MDP1905887.1 efflux RND transporter permease subunit [Pseudomonadota bacterium]MDP2351759.1 efflux RND transporter permease subunit [Pseudomonadota bacterium]